MEQNELKKILEAGLKAEYNGNKKEARMLYGKAIEILKNELYTDNMIKKEKIQRQINSLSNAMERLMDTHKENEDGNSAIEILEEMGLSLENGTGPSMDDVAGMKEVKEEMYTQIIYPLKFPDLAEEFNIKFGGGILLYGPPGNGKTFLVRALAREARMNFIYVNPSSLFSQWFGNFEKNISKLFKASKSLSPCIIFFDELDSLFPSRDQVNSDAAKRGVSQFLNEIGGFSSGGSIHPVVILGATNVPWQLDPAVTRPGRFDRMIYIPPPDLEARKLIIKHYLDKIKRKSEIDIDKIAILTDRYSAADLEYLCKFTTQKAFLRAVEGRKDELISNDSFSEALKEIKPSVNKKVLERYEKYKLSKE
ncbi:MAG: AAA family ATPase [Cuniculiplasma sp.]